MCGPGGGTPHLHQICFNNNRVYLMGMNQIRRAWTSIIAARLEKTYVSGNKHNKRRSKIHRH